MIQKGPLNRSVAISSKTMRIIFLSSLVLVVFGLVTAASQEAEPVCLSRFDYDYKVMTKLVTFEKEQQRQQEEMRDILQKLKEHKVVMETINHSLQQSFTELKDAKTPNHGTSGSTFIRWGRTSCPLNGTEIVYKGTAAGSHQTHTGAAAEYLCLPEDPIWGHYDGGRQVHSAYIYGAEYELSMRRMEDFFGKDVHNSQVPCAQCRSERPTMVMLPGRNKCYDGWTLEYSGYLTGGYYGHAAASQFVCLDGELEVVPNTSGNENGKLFYFAEVVCGSLPCPPYIDNRELTCAVCTK